MKVARIYLRVGTEEQDLSRQDAIAESTKAAGFYIAGVSNNYHSASLTAKLS